MKKLSPLRLLAAAVVATLALTGCGSSAAIQDAAIEKALADASAEINKTCPMEIDSDTRLDNTSTAPGKILQYNYTLTKYAKADLTADQVTQIQDLMKPAVVNELKSNAAMKALKDYQVTFKYNFKSSDGQDLFEFAIAPADYA